ncbi:uncharacterized protein A4U43_C01F7200 [Asparagus officinalis]|uniref:C2 NT-type domain-containing protein n=1 Tax=Asparagus officinalis TaxID=4686 RepID=A0A5P1FS37_ASPOF|nr:uncharacterized protein LOC109835621 [Asparagus officinalis]ONK79521.1 uncharacterized protein A4U43_C01F7200 [Asparagus officinalis]
MNNNLHIARLLETPKSSPEPTKGRLCFWKHRQRSQWAVCLHVHRIRGLPLMTNGQLITVGWKFKGSNKEEKTSPAEVCEGSASFDEVLFYHCSRIEDLCSVLKGVIVSVSLDCDVCRFKIDLSEAMLAEDLNVENGGKLVSFDLEGIGNGGVLSLSVYSTMLEEEEEAGKDDSENNEASKKIKCFSCLPKLKMLRIRRTSSSRSRPGFITIKNSTSRKLDHPQDSEEEESESFITTEKETFHLRHRHPPSDDLRNIDGEEFEDPEEERPCLEREMNSVEQFDAEEVEDEFLRMLEAKRWRAEMRGVGGGLDYNYDLSLDLSLDCNNLSLDLDSLVKEAEEEMNRTVEAWKSKTRESQV